jgi:GNAT superfamily N-acetyltransferase
MRREVVLEDRHTGNYVAATFLDRIDATYARHADDLWLTFLAAEMAKAHASGSPLAVPEHAHWRWERKVATVGHLLLYPTSAIEYDGDAQGLMLLKTDGEFARSPGQVGRPLVYVVFLASAPWNLPTVVARPRFRGVGTMLLRAAVETSVNLGFKGRIGLHALRQSEAFYASIGMTVWGQDPKKENLNYFEMTPEQVAAFLR